MSAALDPELDKAQEAFQEQEDGKLADLHSDGITPADTKVEDG
jgi:hypothetical protein